jgi:hypothetical protein
LHFNAKLQFFLGEATWGVISNLLFLIRREAQISQAQLTPLHHSNETLPANIMQTGIILLHTLLQLKPHINERHLPLQQILLGTIAVNHHRLLLRDLQYRQQLIQIVEHSSLIHFYLELGDLSLRGLVSQLSQNLLDILLDVEYVGDLFAGLAFVGGCGDK